MSTKGMILRERIEKSVLSTRVLAYGVEERC